MLLRTSGAGRVLQQQKLQEWVGQFGTTGPLVYVAIFAVAPSFFLPGLPITLAGGVAFGPVWGTVYASLGSTLGAGVAFLIARYFAREQVRALVGSRLSAIDDGVRKKGWVYVAITRLIPLFPYNLLNYAFGLTQIRFSEYLLVSWICMFPATAAYVVFSSSLLDLLKGKIPRELLIGFVLLGIVASFPFVYRKFQKRKEGS